MKKSYIILFLFCWAGNLEITAQSPVLTAANSNPLIGESFTGQGINYTSPGSSGAGQTWDFSAVISTGTQAFSFIDPSTTTNAASFPSSNITTYNPVTSSYNYMETTSSSLLAYGNYVAPSSLVPYSDPEKILDYPFSMGSMFADTYQGTYMSGPSTVVRKGIDSVMADGYGTLILPYGTLNNVLRVMSIDHYADTTTTGAPFASFTIVTYSWYLANVHYQVLSLTSVNYNGSPVAQFGTYLDQTSVGIIEHDPEGLNINIFPNPSHEMITISADKPVQILKCYNSQGQSIPLKMNNGSIDISALEEGLYFLSLTTSSNEHIVRSFSKN